MLTPTRARIRNGAWVLCLVATLALAAVAAAASPQDDARAFLTAQRLDVALQNLRPDELAAVGQALRVPNRRLTDASLAQLLRNPAAWETGNNARPLLGTLLKSLPTIADVEGINGTIKLASNNDPSNFRGYGVEMIGASALNRYVSEDGARARVTRMGAMIKGIDGRRRESDGAALMGADGLPRLVTIKSISTEKAVSGAMRKAADQLALRNIRRDGTRQPGVIVVGYDSPEVLAKLQGRDWQAAADRSGAGLLVIGVNQLTGASAKLASYSPDPDAALQAKRPGPRPPWTKRFGSFMMKQIGKRSPASAQRISRMRGAFTRNKRELCQSCQSGWRSLFGGRAPTSPGARTARAR